MRSLTAVAVMLLVSGTACAAASFDERVQRARQLEQTPEGKAYQQALWNRIGNFTSEVMHRCFPPALKPDVEFFTLVGDIAASRSLLRIEIRPKTRMSQCFADGFAGASFLPPPAGAGEAGWPIAIEMKLRP